MKESLRITVPAPIVTRSGQTGRVCERIVTPLPIRAPRARRYSTYSGVPARRTIGFACSSTFTSQKRMYARPQTGKSAGLVRPTSSHLAMTGKTHRAMNPVPPKSSDRT